MNLVRIWIPILALLLPLLASPLPAQDALDAVQVQTTTDPTSAAPGQTIHIVITFDVAPGVVAFGVFLAFFFGRFPSSSSSSPESKLSLM